MRQLNELVFVDIFCFRLQNETRKYNEDQRLHFFNHKNNLDSIKDKLHLHVQVLEAKENKLIKINHSLKNQVNCIKHVANKVHLKAEQKKTENKLKLMNHNIS